MSTSQSFATVCRLVRQQVGYVGRISPVPSPDTRLIDIGFDDLDHLEILMAIEDEFGVMMPDLDYITVGDLHEQLRVQLSKKKEEGK